MPLLCVFGEKGIEGTARKAGDDEDLVAGGAEFGRAIKCDPDRFGRVALKLSKGRNDAVREHLRVLRRRLADTDLDDEGLFIEMEIEFRIGRFVRSESAVRQAIPKGVPVR